jgi:hypothetical protein
VHFEPVEDAALNRLDQVARLDPRLLARVAADEHGPLEDDVVELSGMRNVGADGADECAVAEPFAPQNRVARVRHRDDNLLGRSFRRALGGLGSDLPAELVQLRLGAAVDDNVLD